MNRFVPLAAAGLAAVALLGACGSDPEPAAVVNGIEISQQDLVDELEAIDGNAAFVDAYTAAATQAGQPAVRGDEEGTFDTAFVATTLSTRIQYAIVESEVRKRDLQIDQACRDAGRDQLEQRFAQLAPDGDGAAMLDGFGTTYVEYLVDRETDLLALQGDLADQPCVTDSDDVLEAYFEAHQDEFSSEVACASHILVDTQAEADEIEGLLASGGDFAQLAEERSQDPGSAARGGELGCGPEGQYVPEFDAAVFSQPVGEVGPVVQTEFGFHIIEVTSRGVPTLDDVRDQVAGAVAQEVQAAFGNWFTDALGEADIEVDSRYGTWDPTQAIITRPSTDATSTTESPVPTGG